MEAESRGQRGFSVKAHEEIAAEKRQKIKTLSQTNLFLHHK